MDDRTLVFQTYDGGRFEIAESAVKRSEYLTGLLNDYTDTEIPVGNGINKDIMAYVIEYLKHYTNGVQPEAIEKPLTGKKFSECFKTDKWAVDFIEGKDLYTIDAILRAAIPLDIKELISLCSAKFASLIKTLNVTDVVEAFNLDRNFGKEEEEEIMKENQGIMNNLNF